MLNFKRKITYFYQYHNGTVGSTAGFLKLEIRGDKVKIIINIQETPGLPYKEASLYFYHEAGDHLAAVKVDDIESRNGILTYLNRTEWQKLFDTGRDLYTFDGVAVVYNENHYFIGDFRDKDRRDYALVLKEKRAAKFAQGNCTTGCGTGIFFAADTGTAGYEGADTGSAGYEGGAERIIL